MEMKFLYLYVVIQSQFIYIWPLQKLGVIYLKGGKGSFMCCAFSGTYGLQVPSAKNCAGF